MVPNDIINRAADTGDGRKAMVFSSFCVTKRKKRNKGKKERVSKQKISKGCHQGLNVTVLAILQSLEFKIFLVNQLWSVFVIITNKRVGN